MFNRHSKWETELHVLPSKFLFFSSCSAMPVAWSEECEEISWCVLWCWITCSTTLEWKAVHPFFTGGAKKTFLTVSDFFSQLLFHLCEEDVQWKSKDSLALSIFRKWKKFFAVSRFLEDVVLTQSQASDLLCLQALMMLKHPIFFKYKLFVPLTLNPLYIVKPCIASCSVNYHIRLCSHFRFIHAEIHA